MPVAYAFMHTPLVLAVRSAGVARLLAHDMSNCLIAYLLPSHHRESIPRPVAVWLSGLLECTSLEEPFLHRCDVLYLFNSKTTGDPAGLFKAALFLSWPSLCGIAAALKLQLAESSEAVIRQPTAGHRYLLE